MLGLDAAETDFLRAAQDGDVESIRRISSEKREEPLTIAERINEAFSDAIGDVIIENTGDGFAIIEDYREEICEWLKNL